MVGRGKCFPLIQKEREVLLRLLFGRYNCSNKRRSIIEWTDVIAKTYDVVFRRTDTPICLAKLYISTCILVLYCRLLYKVINAVVFKRIFHTNTHVSFICKYHHIIYGGLEGRLTTDFIDLAWLTDVNRYYLKRRPE